MKNIPFLKSKESVAIKKILRVYILQLVVLFSIVNVGMGQYVSDSYANHVASLERLVITSQYFKIVYPGHLSGIAKKTIPLAEGIYKEYKSILGSAPDSKITIYIHDLNHLISTVHARNLSSTTPLWEDNIFIQKVAKESTDWKYLLRYEIAYAFQQAIHSSKLGLIQNFLLSQSAQLPWSAGFPSYLAVPAITPFDVQWLSNYWDVNNFKKQEKWPDDFVYTMLGRSQIRFFNNIYSNKIFKPLYTYRLSYWGQTYFDFAAAFRNTTGVSYLFFANQWKKNQLQLYNNPNFKRKLLDDIASRGDTLQSNIFNSAVNSIESDSLPAQPYHGFFNIRINAPIVLPYYLNTDDFGLGGMVNWQSPLRLHQFLFAGVLSIPSIQNRSFFYTSYVNNSFGPRLKLSYKHYSSASGFLGLSVKNSNVAALSSVWKIDAFSRGYSNWYAGMMIRHLFVDYFSEDNASDKNSTIVFDNTQSLQTDLRLSLAWRVLEPNEFNIIHPLDGHGLKLSVTGSGPVLNPDTQYSRYYAEGFLILPAIDKQRIYLYGAGAYDAGEPIGGDYLAFTGRGNYQLPEPKLIGSASPTIEGYIRGYDHSIAAERFLWGSVEYRIPLVMNTGQSLLGTLFPGIALAVFVDGGILGGARTANRSNYTEYRYSFGTELKSMLGFKDVNIAYKVGIAQALDQPFGPQLYFTIQSAIPF